MLFKLNFLLHTTTLAFACLMILSSSFVPRNDYSLMRRFGGGRGSFVIVSGAANEETQESKDLFSEMLSAAAAAFNKSKSILRSDGLYDDYEESIGMEYGLRYYREYAKRGIKRFMERNLQGALDDFDRAMQSNDSQPLMQRGITLYLLDRYAEAASQLQRDVELIEKPKVSKASDLRLWLCACLNKLGQLEEARAVLEVLELPPSGLIENRFLMNATLEFYAGQKSLEDMLEIIGATDEKDTFGTRFYGNFYLALYHDSINEYGLAQAFLAFPCNSKKYSQKDMWFHLPRAFADQRKWALEYNDDSEGRSDSSSVTADGLMLF